jgi:hypothetical protein
LGFLEKNVNRVGFAAAPSDVATENVKARVPAWRDGLGMVASIGCAIHCAAMPFVIAYLPALGLSFLADEAFHKWMALVCFLIAIIAFIPGIRKHGNWTPISIGAVGLVFITFAAFGLAGECCSSCQAAEAPAHAMVVDTGCDQCEDCEHCQSSTNVDGSESAIVPLFEPTPEKDLLATLAPWITPLGGLLLVSAHLLNRRYGCLCGCC